MVKGLFITGTDTGVGKTVITGLLARCMLAQGLKVITQKWVQTGCQGFAQDIQSHLDLMRKRRAYIQDYTRHVCPYIFRRAASPHLAAECQRRKINSGTIKTSFLALHKNFDFVIVEGAGGALVPLSKKEYVIDIADDLNLPVLLVAANRLGAINHAILTMEALRARKLPVVGIVFNNFPGQDSAVLLDNPRIVKLLTRAHVFGALGWVNDKEALYQRFLPIGKNICQKIAGWPKI